MVPRGFGWPAVSAAILVALVSLCHHAPAWLLNYGLAGLSQGQLSLSLAQGFWHRGQGELQLKGSDEAMPLSWNLAWTGLGVRLSLSPSPHGVAAVRGDIICHLLAGCEGRNLAGELPAAWLAQVAPPVKSIGLRGNIAWQSPRFHWATTGGGSGELVWQSAVLTAVKLDLPLGRYAGRISANWSGAERQPEGQVNLYCSEAPRLVPGLKFQATGRLSAVSVDLAGRIELPAKGDGRYSSLLQLLGLSAEGGDFRYRSDTGSGPHSG